MMRMQNLKILNEEIVGLLIKRNMKANRCLISAKQIRMLNSDSKNTKKIFDKRLSEESKVYFTENSKLMNLKLFKEKPLDDVRKFIDTRTYELNKSIKIENIIEKEFFVKNTNDSYEVPVSAYIPKDTKPNSPIMIYFHGGGWTYGSRKSYYHAIASLASQSKCIWLSVEYRLAPEYKFPIFLDDCLSVVKWVAENKVKTFNCEKNIKIGVGGDSAGGTMAASISHELRNVVDFQMLIYSAVQFKKAFKSYKEFESDDYLLTSSFIKYITLKAINSLDDLESSRWIPMLNKDFTNLPGALIIAAELDPFVDDGREYHKLLKENKNYCELHVIKGTLHGFFNWPALVPKAFAETSGHIIKFLSRFTS